MDDYEECCTANPDMLGCGGVSLDLDEDKDEDNSLCGSDDKETSLPKSFRVVSPSEKSDESSGIFEDCPGILLTPKRAVGHRDYHERHVSFQPIRASGTPADILDESASGFLNRIFSKMFVCGSTNQVVD
ncbi:hypothetical protein ACHAW5_010926 [Stephanodiscus triporus]|uniref:Uncharacterized protein n=1 Tax=Stephanodiscus triporus TaxID=2934178 RepID=A0ABD3PDY0_9STRA